MFQIHTGIPVPELTTPGRKPTSYPLSELAIGESFFIPLNQSSSPVVQNRIRGAIFKYKKTTRTELHKFRIKTVCDPVSNAQAVGVWRVA